MDGKINMAKNKFINFFMTIATMWWVFWSNLRFKKAVKHISVRDEDLIEGYDPVTVRKLAKSVYNKFDYTPDGFDKLWDAITPPTQLYKDYTEGNVKDDCDGFHSLLHYFLNWGCDKGEELLKVGGVYLLSVVARGGGHCVLVYKYKDKWHVVDYKNVYKGFDTIEEAVKDYNIIYKDKYKDIKSDVYYNALVDYNYDKGKFKRVKFKDVK